MRKYIYTDVFVFDLQLKNIRGNPLPINNNNNN